MMDDQFGRALARRALASAGKTSENLAVPKANGALAKKPAVANFNELIVVVAGEAERAPDRGVHDPVGAGGGMQGDLDLFEQPRAHDDRPAGPRIQATELRVGPESAAGLVHGRELLLQNRAGIADTAGFADTQRRGRAEGGERGRREAHEPPETATGGVDDTDGGCTGGGDGAGDASDPSAGSGGGGGMRLTLRLVDPSIVVAVGTRGRIRTTFRAADDCAASAVNTPANAVMVTTVAPVTVFSRRSLLSRSISRARRSCSTGTEPVEQTVMKRG